jgi:hypothetical protein
MKGKWSNKDAHSALMGVEVVGKKLAQVIGDSAQASFKAVFGELTFARSTADPGYWGEYGGGTITFYAGARQWTTLVAHELGHAFNARIANNGGVTPYTTLSQNGIWTEDGEQIAGIMAGFTVPGTGTTCGNRGTRQCFDSDGNPIPANPYYRSFDGLGFNHSDTLTSNEDFADTFANWATNSFDNNKYGSARSSFMTTNIAEWVTSARGGR